MKAGPHAKRKMWLGRGTTCGFTLMEALIAMAVATLLIAATLHLYFHYRMAYLSQEQLNEMHHNARTASELIAFDMRMAGYGVPTPYSDLPRWVNWVPNMTDIVVATPSSSAAGGQRLSIAGVFDPPVTELSAGVGRGSTVLPVPGKALVNFNLTDRKMILVGGLETARIVSFGSDRLNISAHPTLPGKGLRNRYPAGTPIEVVSVVHYEVEPSPEGYPHRPYLMRYTSATPPSLAASLAVVGIEHLQAAPTSDGAWEVEVRGRAPTPSLRYRHPEFEDAYRRYQLVTALTPRNRRP